jgi:hypothetical protein
MTTKEFFKKLPDKAKKEITYQIKHLPWYAGETLTLKKTDAIWSSDKRFSDRKCVGKSYKFECQVGTEFKYIVVNHYWERYEVEG